MKRRAFIKLSGAAILAATASTQSQAQTQGWPSRPIKVIVPTGAGAATDVMARLMADSVTHGLGQPVVVENQPGASGLIAHQNAARSAPDGYTFLFTNTSGLATNPVSFKSLPYDPARDFTPVAMIVDFGPQILSINAEMPIKTAPELIAYAKANPGKLTFGAGSTSSISTLGSSGGGAKAAVGAAARAPDASRPTSRASVARPLRWAQSARVAMPANWPSTKQRSSRVGSRVGASARSTVRPPRIASAAV